MPEIKPRRQRKALETVLGARLRVLGKNKSRREKNKRRKRSNKMCGEKARGATKTISFKEGTEIGTGTGKSEKK